MNKNELVSAVAEKAGLSKADAASAVDAVFEAVQGELKNGGEVRLAGFGSFSVSRREASKGRNPSTGAEVDIPARNVPKFSAGKGLKEKLLAALRGGIKKVLIPEENAKDLAEIPDNVKNNMEIIPVSLMSEVLAHALTRKPEPIEWDGTVETPVIATVEGAEDSATSLAH